MVTDTNAPHATNLDSTDRLPHCCPYGDVLRGGERATVDDGQTALGQLLERLVNVPPSAGSTPRQV